MQSAWVDELRTRTGVLLAAASVSSAFLGATAIKLHGFNPITVGALIGFLGVILLCLSVLSPTDEWEFAYDATDLDEHYIEKDVSLRNMHRSMAAGYAASRRLNRDRLKWRFRLFRFACFALGIDVLLWLLAIRA